MHRYRLSGYTNLVVIISILITFSSISLSWVPHEYPNHVYASNLSCVQITELMTCEEQQNGSRSSDGTGSGIADENEVDGTSASNNENDEIPLIIPDFSPTLDENDGDDGSGQENSEDGTDGVNSEEGNDRASNANDNNNDDDDLEISAPSVLPFP